MKGTGKSNGNKPFSARKTGKIRVIPRKRGDECPYGPAKAAICAVACRECESNGGE